MYSFPTRTLLRLYMTHKCTHTHNLKYQTVYSKRETIAGKNSNYFFYSKLVPHIIFKLLTDPTWKRMLKTPSKFKVVFKISSHRRNVAGGTWNFVVLNLWVITFFLFYLLLRTLHTVLTILITEYLWVLLWNY